MIIGRFILWYFTCLFVLQKQITCRVYYKVVIFELLMEFLVNVYLGIFLDFLESGIHYDSTFHLFLHSFFVFLCHSICIKLSIVVIHLTFLIVLITHFAILAIFRCLFIWGLWSLTLLGLLSRYEIVGLHSRSLSLISNRIWKMLSCFHKYNN